MFLRNLLYFVLIAVNCLFALDLTDQEKEYLANKKQIEFVITNYPPFEFVNKTNEFDGMTVELIRWIATEAGFKTNFTMQSFSDAKTSVLSAKKDVLTTFFYSDERAKSYSFTQMLFNIPASIFIRSERTDIKDLNDLRGKTIAVQKEDFAIEFLQKQKIDCSFKFTDNFGEATELVIQGQADAVIGDEQVVLYHLFSTASSEKVKKIGTPLYGGVSCMGSQLNSQVLINILNKGIKEAQNKGIIDKINNKWLGVQLGQSSSIWNLYGKIAVFILTIALIVILVLWLWNSRLKKLIAVRAKALEEEMNKRLEGEKRYRLITENTVDVIWSMDLNFKFTSMSPSVELFLKIPQKLAFTQDYKTYLTPDTALDFSAKVTKMLANATNILSIDSSRLILEMQFVDANGQIRYGESHISIMFDNDGKPYEIVGVTRDITERQHAENALISSERQKKLILSTIPDMIFTISGDGRYTDFKPGIRNPLLKPENIIGSFVQDMPVSPQLREYLLNGVKEAIATNELQVQEYSLGAGANQQYYEARIIKIADNEVISIVRDITDRKMAESSLAYEKEQLSTTLRSIGDGVIVADENRNILLFNKAAETILETKAYKTYGQLVSSVFSVRNIINLKTINPLEMVLQTGVNYLPENDFLLQTASGSEKIITLSAAPILDSEGKVNGGVLSFRDVSERIRLQEEINKSQKLESIGLLAGGIAHDFNNYLTGILGNISLVKFKAESGEVFYQLLVEAEKAALRAKDLTLQLLTFAKGGAPVKEHISIEALIKDSAEFVLRGSQSACAYSFQPDLWTAVIDKGQVSQVIQNVIMNSSQAMKEGGRINVKVENYTISNSNHIWLEDGQYLKIEIADNGPGISEEHLKKIFEPYFTTKDQNHGLGLSICHSIVRRHGGDIEVSSELGQGAVFTVYLPATQQKVERIEKAKVNFKGNGEKILFMDDEEMLREFAANLFASFGYHCDCFADGASAIEAFKAAMEQNSPYNLVVTDLTVPGGVGGEVVIQEILKSDPAAKVIVSSGYSTHPIMSNYQSYGFKGVILKPFEIDKFFLIVKEILAS